jgi:hypothetical protein
VVGRWYLYIFISRKIDFKWKKLKSLCEHGIQTGDNLGVIDERIPGDLEQDGGARGGEAEHDRRSAWKFEYVTLG